MPKKKEKKEIVVDGPSRRRRAEALIKDTTGVEAVDVFRICAKIGRCLSGLMIIAGALLSLISMYSILTSAQFLFSDPIFIGVLGFLGAVNILCGLILLAKE